MRWVVFDSDGYKARAATGSSSLSVLQPIPLVHTSIHCKYPFEPCQAGGLRNQLL